MANARTARGRKTQRILAEYLNTRGWPFAESREGSTPGPDLIGTPAMDWEVKATADGPLTAAIRQLARRRKGGELGVVVWRPNGYGPERIDEWVFAMPLVAAIELLREAGYGTTAPRSPLEGTTS